MNLKLKIFKISLTKNNSIISFIISTIYNSIIFDYDKGSNKLLLNTQLNLNKKEIIVFAQNIFDNYILLLVTIKSILLFNINENGIKETQIKNFDDNNAKDKMQQKREQFNQRFFPE